MTTAERVMQILGGDWAKCRADGCMHHSRGIIRINGDRNTAPGIYCQCCAKASEQGEYESDAYTCTGRLIRRKKRLK